MHRTCVRAWPLRRCRARRQGHRDSLTHTGERARHDGSLNRRARKAVRHETNAERTGAQTSERKRTVRMTRRAAHTRTLHASRAQLVSVVASRPSRAASERRVSKQASESQNANHSARARLLLLLLLRCVFLRCHSLRAQRKVRKAYESERADRAAAAVALQQQHLMPVARTAAKRASQPNRRARQRDAEAIASSQAARRAGRRAGRPACKPAFRRSLTHSRSLGRLRAFTLPACRLPADVAGRVAVSAAVALRLEASRPTQLALIVAAIRVRAERRPSVPTGPRRRDLLRRWAHSAPLAMRVACNCKQAASEPTSASLCCAALPSLVCGLVLTSHFHFD